MYVHGYVEINVRNTINKLSNHAVSSVIIICGKFALRTCVYMQYSMKI
jgi:hypothetical protein